MTVSPLPAKGRKGFPHVCDRRRCLEGGEQLPSGAKHYPHKGAICHHQGEDPARCHVHGALLQFNGGHEIRNRYPKPVCYECLPPHRPGCPILLTGKWNTCICPERQAAVGQVRVQKMGAGQLKVTSKDGFILRGV